MNTNGHTFCTIFRQKHTLKCVNKGEISTYKSVLALTVVWNQLRSSQQNFQKNFFGFSSPFYGHKWPLKIQNFLKKIFFCKFCWLLRKCFQTTVSARTVLYVLISPSFTHFNACFCLKIVKRSFMSIKVDVHFPISDLPMDINGPSPPPPILGLYNYY